MEYQDVFITHCTHNEEERLYLVVVFSVACLALYGARQSGVLI
jgi:hypothetical protein